jgi:hypothetical protein
MSDPIRSKPEKGRSRAPDFITEPALVRPWAGQGWPRHENPGGSVVLNGDRDFRKALDATGAATALTRYSST